MNLLKRMAVLGALAAAGCSASINTVSRADPEGHPHVVADQRVITDRNLNSYTQVVGVSESVVSGDLTKVQVDVWNSQSDPATFYYKFEWYDDQEMLVESPMSIWTERTIQGGEQISLVGVAPNPRAKDFRLKLQLNH